MRSSASCWPPPAAIPTARSLGWYHSHTRSEIFLSAEDLEIHNRFFPEPWQFALVLKPHTFQPMRAGFFFREQDGSIHSAAAYQEFVVEPLPMRPVAVQRRPRAAPALPQSPRHGARRAGYQRRRSRRARIQSAASRSPSPRRSVPAPAFLAAAASHRRRRAAGRRGRLPLSSEPRWAPGRGTPAREWLPQSPGNGQRYQRRELGLSSIDRDGQLQVQWNGKSRAALASSGASLLIVDGGQTHTVELGRPHVLTGSFTYARKTGKVDMTLVLPQPGGKEIREATIFAGDPPGQRNRPRRPRPAGPDAAALAAENAQLRADNAVQVERNKRLEKAMDELRKVIQREEQRKRLELQSPDTGEIVRLAAVILVLVQRPAARRPPTGSRPSTSAPSSSSRASPRLTSPPSTSSTRMPSVFRSATSSATAVPSASRRPVPGGRFEGEFSADGKLLEGWWTQRDGELPIRFVPGNLRPQEPRPPFPYDAEAVAIRAGRVRLAGDAHAASPLRRPSRRRPDHGLRAAGPRRHGLGTPALPGLGRFPHPPRFRGPPL